jgi:hypothetical protein
VGTWLRQAASGVTTRATLSISDLGGAVACRSVTLNVTEAATGR